MGQVLAPGAESGYSLFDAIPLGQGLWYGGQSGRCNESETAAGPYQNLRTQAGYEGQKIDGLFGLSATEKDRQGVLCPLIWGAPSIC